MTDISTAIHNDISMGIPKQISCERQLSGGHPHYSIYAYDKFVEGEMGANKWIMLQSDYDKSRILTEAKQLYGTQRYQKIEVKEKSFDSKKQRNRIQTVQVLGHRKIRNKGLIITGFIMALSVVGLALIGVL